MLIDRPSTPPTADPRLPIRLVPAGACLPPGGVAMPTLPTAPRRHMAACACCQPRPAAADMLSRAWLARVRGTAPLTAELVISASTEDQASLRAAITSDALLAARFRLADAA